MTAAKKMQVQMKDRLSGAATVVEHSAITGEKIALRGEFRGHELQFAQQRLIAVLRVV